jgi:hypothetical protein
MNKHLLFVLINARTTLDGNTWFLG